MFFRFKKKNIIHTKILTIYISFSGVSPSHISFHLHGFSDTQFFHYFYVHDNCTQNLESLQKI